MFSTVSSKVGLDLLWAAEKEVATRGLGVPVDTRRGRELKLEPERASPCRSFPLFIQSVPVVFDVIRTGKQDL